MADFNALKAKLLENQEKKSGNNNNKTSRKTGDNASFPFWDTPFGQSSTVRLYPDGDPDNVFFWQKREVIKLPFQGVVGGDYPTDKEVTVTVPCVDMFGKSCPIIAEMRPLWKGSEDDINLARLYYKKKSYIFQGSVVNSPIVEEDVPENPIRRFIFLPSIFDVIETSLMDMEDSPTDYTLGRDFKIVKTQKGQYANYQSSSWSLRTRALNESELTSIEQYGLRNLKEFLGPEPDADGMEAIKAMFRDSLAGKPYDMAAYGNYYRPYSNKDGDDAPVRQKTEYTPKAESAPKAEAPKAETPKAEAPAPALEAKSEGATSASAILERIKNRTRD